MNDRDHVRWEQKVIRTDGCWEWIGAISDVGYGKMGHVGKCAYAHRLAYEHYVGPIPEGLVIDHLCRNRSCVNPDHMEPVSHRINLLRGESMSAIHAKKTECPKGHPYAGENLYAHPNGSRQCRTCKREARAEGRWS
jgi:hypothetical protein